MRRAVRLVVETTFEVCVAQTNGNGVYAIYVVLVHCDCGRAGQTNPKYKQDLIELL